MYHVKKFNSKEYGDYSKVFIFDVDKNEFEFANQKAKIDEDLGIPYLRAKYAKEYKEQIDSFDKILKERDKETNKLKHIIHDLNKPVLFVEDTYEQIYKIAWLKLHNKTITIENFENEFKNNAPFMIYKCEGADCLFGLLNTKNIEYWKHKKLIGLFDFDEKGVDRFKSLKSNGWDNNDILGDLSTGFYKKRQEANCFCAILIPIPDRLKHVVNFKETKSFVEIENLLKEDFLEDNFFATTKDYYGIQYLEVKSDKKSKIWKKLFDLGKEAFKDFQQLFDTIENIFNE